VFTTQAVELDDTIVVRCEGRLVRSEAANQLRHAVQSDGDHRKIILDFSELKAVEAGGLGMLAFLRRWTAENGITLKILHPTARVERRLKELELRGAGKFEIEHGPGVMRLVGFPDRKYWVASSLAA
jgi:anti-anti-sigma regulatory factor